MIFVIILLFLFTGCETENKADIIWNGPVPNDCIFSAFIIKAWVETQKDTKVKDFTVVNLLSEPCFSTMKKLRCQYDYFGINEKTKELNIIDMNKTNEYREYQNCLNRK